MSMQQILTAARSLDGVFELAPDRGSEYPEISWGDFYFYYAPEKTVPGARQPYATVVTKDYPGDESSRLRAPDRWRLNIHTGSSIFGELIGCAPDEIDQLEFDLSADDVFNPHPLYGAAGWVCVVNPGTATSERAVELLRGAHDADRRRFERRQRG